MEYSGKNANQAVGSRSKGQQTMIAWAKSCLQSIFPNKVLLDHSHSHWLTCCVQLLSQCKGRVGWLSWDFFSPGLPQKFAGSCPGSLWRGLGWGQWCGIQSSSGIMHWEKTRARSVPWEASCSFVLQETPLTIQSHFLPDNFYSSYLFSLSWRLQIY